MGYVRQLGQCKADLGHEDSAGPYGLCKTVRTVEGSAWIR
jgi:hypothetical protein